MNYYGFVALRWSLVAVETLLSCLLFFFKAKRRKHTIIRLVLGLITIASLITGLSFLNGYLLTLSGFEGVVAAIVSTASYLILFSLIFIFMLILFVGNPFELFSNYLKAYATRQFAFALYIVIVEAFNPALNFLDINYVGLNSCLLYIFIYLLVYLAFFILIRKRVIDVSLNKLDTSLLVFYNVIFFFNIVLSSICEYYSTDNNLMYIMVMISELLSLVLVISFDVYVKKSRDLKIDNYINSRLLKQQEWQFKFAKTNMESLKIKAHDLKHQVRILRQGGDEADKLLKKLEDEIGTYNEIVVTDNQVLNIILQEKWFYCKKHNIKLTTNVNPNAFSKVSNTDLYILLGNILDNAIEAVMKIQDKEQRVISVEITSKNSLSSIRCDNYYVGNLEYDKESKSFITSKSDKVSHGLGIKSIELLAHKYQGTTKITTDSNIFTIIVTIPDFLN